MILGPYHYITNPLNLSWDIVDLRYDFINFNFEKFLSAKATVTGIVNKICRVTNCSPHLDGNRKWAQLAQYNKFVREWVKELG